MSVIEKPHKAPSRQVWLDEKSGKPTRYNVYREDVREAANFSRSPYYMDCLLYTSLSVSEELPATVLTVQISAPCEGLSEQGELRAADYLADRVEQLLENELKLSALMKSRGGN